MAAENEQHKENYDYVALQFQLLRDIIKPYALAALLRNFSQKEVDMVMMYGYSEAYSERKIKHMQ